MEGQSVVLVFMMWFNVKKDNDLLKTFPTHKIDTEANNQPHLLVKKVVSLYFCCG